MPKRWNTNDFKASKRDDTHGRRHDRHAQTADKRQGSYRLRDIRTTSNRVFNGPNLRETPPTNQTTETVKSRIISLEILLHAQRQTIMRQGRSIKDRPCLHISMYTSTACHHRPNAFRSVSVSQSVRMPGFWHKCMAGHSSPMQGLSLIHI